MTEIKLQYTNCWFELGILTEEELAYQEENFNENPYPEHWYYNTIISYLQRKRQLTEEEIEKLLNCLAGKEEIIQHIYLHILDQDKCRLPDTLFAIYRQQFICRCGDWARMKATYLTAKRAIANNTHNMEDINEWVAYKNRALQDLKSTKPTKTARRYYTT